MLKHIVLTVVLAAGASLCDFAAAQKKYDAGVSDKGCANDTVRQLPLGALGAGR